MKAKFSKKAEQGNDFTSEIMKGFNEDIEEVNNIINENEKAMKQLYKNFKVMSNV